MHRLAVLALLLLSLPLMASTCEFRASTGDGHHCRELEGDRDCDGVGVIVDTRVDGGVGSASLLAGSGADEGPAVLEHALQAESVEPSLAASFVSLGDLAPALEAASAEPVPSGGSAAGAEPFAAPAPGRITRASEVPIGELSLEPEDLAGVVPASLEPRGEVLWTEPIEGAGATATPEPGAGALFAVGVLLVAWRMRRPSR